MRLTAKRKELKMKADKKIDQFEAESKSRLKTRQARTDKEEEKKRLEE